MEPSLLYTNYVSKSPATIQLAQLTPTEKASSASSKEVSREVGEAWKGWKKRFLVELPHGTIVYDLFNKWASSEGTGYGMYLATQLNDQKTFDELLKGYENYFKKENGLANSFLNKTGGLHRITEKTRYPSASSSDADIYIAAALIQAHSLVVAGKWKPPSGKSYLEKARVIMNAIWENEIESVEGKLVIKPSDGEWCKLVIGRTIYNPSYFTPTWLKLFSQVDSNPEHNWDKVISDGYDLINLILEKSNTLKPRGQNPIPDFVLVWAKDGEFKVASANEVIPDDEYNGIRTPLEIGRDAILNNDARAANFLRKFLNKANVTDEKSVQLHGYNNEIAWACYGTAVRGASDPYGTLESFRSAIKKSFNGSYFGHSKRDATDYFKQCIVLMGGLLIL